jgi:MipA family protein
MHRAPDLPAAFQAGNVPVMGSRPAIGPVASARAPLHAPDRGGALAHVLKVLRRTVLAASVLAAPTPALAEAPLWELGVGLGTLQLAHYRGAAQSHRWLLPLPYAVYRGPLLRADRDGARAVLFEDRQLEIDLSLAASPPLRSRDNRAREGMPDLPPTIELGPNLNATLWQRGDAKLQLRLPVRAVAAIDGGVRQRGFSAAPVINLDWPVQGWNLGLQAGLLFGDARLHRHLYSVAPEFATLERPAYQARGGRAGWQATMALSRRFDGVWVGAFVRRDSVAGAAFADSPLVQRESHLAYGLAVSWVLARSAVRVPRD